jgi:hypothetical protein
VQYIRVDVALDLLQYFVAACECYQHLPRINYLNLRIFQVFSALRVYAMSNRSILLFIAIFALNMAPFDANVVSGRRSYLYNYRPDTTLSLLFISIH